MVTCLASPDGITRGDPTAGGMDIAIARCAHEVVVLANCTKVGVDTMFQTVPVGSITQLVTDKSADEDELSRLTEAGCTCASHG